MKHLVKLISEYDIVFPIKGKQKEDDLNKLFVGPSLKTIQDHIIKDIMMAKLYKKHFYRIEVIVHAQEIDKDE